MKRDWIGVAVFAGCTVAAIAVGGAWFLALYAVVRFAFR